MKNKSDDLIFHTTICVEASQIAYDATKKSPMRISLSDSYAKRFGMEFVMKKNIINILFIVMFGCLLCSCEDLEKEEKKLGELEFEILTDEDLPTEVENIIFDRQKSEFMTTYTDKDDLYIIIGYGKQATGGYSIRVDELYETKNNIYIGTTFLGPERNEKVTQAESYPHIVVKLKHIDKTVVFK
ncbi:MAG: protease complex subunit PrcB family protein [Lachnospiraceae bacterium]|nr:protease complex subunit PrcB family protein [Lachnospiraceae bacterium]